MFSNIVNILNFGFLGLAFLMLYLAYNLISKSAAADNDIKKNEADLIKRFMNISITFMILAGPLQWATIWIKNTVTDKQINLKIALNKTSWDDSFGSIYIRNNGKEQAITFNSISKEFKNNDELLLNVYEISDTIKKMRKQIEILNSKILSNEKLIKNTLGEG